VIFCSGRRPLSGGEPSTIQHRNQDGRVTAALRSVGITRSTQGASLGIGPWRNRPRWRRDSGSSLLVFEGTQRACTGMPHMQNLPCFYSAAASAIAEHVGHVLLCNQNKTKPTLLNRRRLSQIPRRRLFTKRCVGRSVVSFACCRGFLFVTRHRQKGRRRHSTTRSCLTGSAPPHIAARS
jgi:hypothetical protein